MPDEDRVFDVSRPGRSAAEPSGKPVIVGHRPTLSDPMMKDEANPMDFGTESKPTKISVSGAEGGHETHDLHDLGAHHDLGLTTPPASWGQPAPEEPAPELPAAAPEPAIPAHDDSAPGIITAAEPVPLPQPADQPAAPEMPAEEPGAAADQPADKSDSGPPDESKAADVPPPSEPLNGVEALHFQPERRQRGRAKFILLGLLVLLVAVYLAIDAGVIASGVKLPFHIFSQKNTPAATEQAPAVSNPAPAASASLPAGFTKYSLSGTDINFAAPAAWGQPASNTESGYSSRSSAAKPDGTYAYLVTFSANKDIQIAVTSSKYLPPARDTTYYDYLQWCSGTNDGKFYESILHFTTANGVDTPSTVSCDQGPLLNAVKLNATTIVQQNIKDAKNNPVGDLYAKNLDDKNTPILRIKDATMKNTTDIRALLATVKATGTIAQ